MSAKTTVQQVVSAVPASNAVYPVTLPPGTYLLSLAVKSSVTGTTTVVTARPYADRAHTTVGNQDLRMVELNSSTAVANLTLPEGAAGRYALVGVLPAGVPTQVPVPLPFGLQIGVTKGGATADELLEVTLTATLVS